MKIICDMENPYVFVSYSHEDQDKVYEALRVLHDEYGLNLWYDESMNSGHWQEKAFIAMDDLLCKAVVLFASKSALTSKSVLKELKNAAFPKKRKKGLVVVNFENKSFEDQFYDILDEFNRTHHEKVEIVKEMLRDHLKPEVLYVPFGDYQRIYSAIRDEAPQVFRDVVKKSVKIEVKSESGDKLSVPKNEQPEPMEEQPEPVEEQPEPMEEQPEPVEEQPEPVEEQPEPMEEQPELVEEQPESMEEQSEPVEEHPAPQEGSSKGKSTENSEEMHSGQDDEAGKLPPSDSPDTSVPIPVRTETATEELVKTSRFKYTKQLYQLLRSKAELISKELAERHLQLQPQIKDGQIIPPELVVRIRQRGNVLVGMLKLVGGNESLLLTISISTNVAFRCKDADLKFDKDPKLFLERENKIIAFREIPDSCEVSPGMKAIVQYLRNMVI